MAFDNALWHDRVADPSQRDPETVALRGLVQAVREDERVVSVLLPVGDGLLAAIKRDWPTCSAGGAAATPASAAGCGCRSRWRPC